MELRLVSTDAEKARIAQVKSVASRGRYREFTAHTGASMPRVYDEYGRLYALFDSSDKMVPEDLMGGFAVHSLDEFAQSHSDPILTGLSLSKVFEIDELWILKRDKIQPLLRGILILAGLSQLEGLLVYPTIIPNNSTVEFATFHRVTDPLRSGKQRDVWVQGMLLHTERLRLAVAEAMAPGFEVHPGLTCIRFMEDTADAVAPDTS